MDPQGRCPGTQRAGNGERSRSCRRPSQERRAQRALVRCDHGWERARRRRCPPRRRCRRAAPRPSPGPRGRGSRSTDPRKSGAPSIVSGGVAVGGRAVAPSEAAARPAPSAGSERLRSPMSTALKRRPASKPQSRRIAVPELPQSRSRAGARRARSAPHPRPQVRLMPRRRLRGSTWNRDPRWAPERSEPKPRVQVDPVRTRGRGTKPSSERRGRPEALRDGYDRRAVAARISHRWAIDLSPGTLVVP